MKIRESYDNLNFKIFSGMALGASWTLFRYLLDNFKLFYDLKTFLRAVIHM